jgi:hypothetical protein
VRAAPREPSPPDTPDFLVSPKPGYGSAVASREPVPVDGAGNQKLSMRNTPNFLVSPEPGYGSAVASPEPVPVHDAG